MGEVDILTIESVRKSLIQQEDTIVFTLIERAKFPMNFPAYDSDRARIPGFSGSLVDYVVQQTEAIQSKVGRYESPEEQPFFPDNLPSSILVPPPNYPQILHPAATSININRRIWDFYFNELLPLFVVEGDNGNYVPTVACDLDCLQALSRRIHYGKYVAEVKFTGAPEDYGPAIRAQDGEALMKLLTFESVEAMVKKRVEKKSMVFGQEVSLNDDNNADEKKGKYKVDPSIVSRLYEDWVMPLTKEVQVEYLLRRLD
ncbi:hypothetical protein LguiA_036563 [Lonicera macranthoides]